MVYFNGSVRNLALDEYLKGDFRKQNWDIFSQNHLPNVFIFYFIIKNQKKKKKRTGIKTQATCKTCYHNDLRVIELKWSEVCHLDVDDINVHFGVVTLRNFACAIATLQLDTKQTQSLYKPNCNINTNHYKGLYKDYIHIILVYLHGHTVHVDKRENRPRYRVSDWVKSGSH